MRGESCQGDTGREATGLAGLSPKRTTDASGALAVRADAVGTGWHSLTPDHRHASGP